mmetsp:Transcript_91943/g.201521  ORF Transcript_91943/g.201521 Transcript_91943/m.201521 type:complete len:340 (+) Transcript_91943:3059-4078(+)
MDCCNISVSFAKGCPTSLHDWPLPVHCIEGASTIHCIISFEERSCVEANSNELFREQDLLAHASDTVVLVSITQPAIDLLHGLVKVGHRQWLPWMRSVLRFFWPLHQFRVGPAHHLQFRQPFIRIGNEKPLHAWRCCDSIVSSGPEVVGVWPTTVVLFHAPQEICIWRADQTLQPFAEVCERAIHHVKGIAVRGELGVQFLASRSCCSIETPCPLQQHLRHLGDDRVLTNDIDNGIHCADITKGFHKSELHVHIFAIHSFQESLRKDPVYVTADPFAEPPRGSAISHVSLDRVAILDAFQMKLCTLGKVHRCLNFAEFSRSTATHSTSRRKPSVDCASL